ncbi:baseplate hub + tail lysozyme [Agrobacterium phage Atu_ph04]|uniref:Baseplate hub + tail lysozyme n=1 Tax=Agrobacterium phage Atu_ph04 TaxID=2024263 RepID=A0A223VZY5_9CAUD|nr:baseplate hub + tail lysozyme [Agrobacterium phage Atu_ph04]ASV44619.1 baseplate hub + tail lysozyme [Agrobacterium phage Atu_ph04]
MTSGNNLFGGIYSNLLDDIKKSAQETRKILNVPISAGLDIQKWFKDPIKAIQNFKNFDFRFLEGRVPFDVFEKTMVQRAENVYANSNLSDFESAVSIFENLLDDLTDDEKDTYDEVRYKVHKIVSGVETLTSSGFHLEILEDYSDSPLKSIFASFFQDWRYYVDNSDRSLRDQLISLSEFIREIRGTVTEIALDFGWKENLRYIASTCETLEATIASVLNEFPVELESMVESLSNLLVYTKVRKIQRGRSSQIASIIKNPLFQYVKSDFLRAKTSSVSKLATSFAQDTNPTTQVNAAQASVAPEARIAAPAYGTGERIQQESSVDTTPSSGTVGPMTQSQWDSFRNWLLQRESSGNYKAVNRFGFCGGYQFGGPALQDLGYARPGTSTRSLAIDSSWTGKNGASSRDSFLGNSNLQDQVCLEWFKILYKRILSSGIVSKESSPAHVGGMLAVAHLLGPGGARDLKNGVNGNDANGTSAQSYYDAGAAAVGGSTQTTSPTEATQFRNQAETNTVFDSAQITIPSSEAAPIYPYNQTRTFESGHFEEFDNTPGFERVNLRHKSGSGYEYRPDGGKTAFVKGDKYEAIAGNDFIIVEGICNIYVKGNAGIVSEGDVNINAGNDLNMLVGGDFNLKIGGKQAVQVSGSSFENIQGDSARVVGGFSVISSDGDMQIDSASNSIVSRDGSTNVVSKGNLSLVTSSDYALTVSGSKSDVTKGKSVTVSYGDTFLVASGKMTVNGSDAIFHGANSSKLSSNGTTTVAGAGTIKLSHPVEKALYSDTAGIAVPGSPSPVTPSGSASDGGGAQVKTENEKRPEKKKIDAVVEKYTAQNFDSTMANSGGGEGKKPSEVDPLTIA